MTLMIAFFSFIAWLVLAYGRGGFWRANIRLGEAPPPASWPKLAIIIPARNEAGTIGEVVAAHLAGDYPGERRIFLIDDHSDDGTAEAALKAANGDERLTLIEGAPLPAGWTGKLWAVRQGVDKASATAPDYFLFTDADIVMGPDTLRRLVAMAERDRLSLTSLMARLDARGAWGGLLIPAFIFFFQKLYPFPLSNAPDENVAAAAGGCMLVSADALAASGGLEEIRGELIDDCALARRIKDHASGARIWIGLAHDDEAVSLRDNRSFGSVWNMAARTAYAQLRASPLMLAGTVLGMAFLYLAPPFIALSFFAHHHFWAMAFALAAWGVMARLYWETLKLYRQQPWQSTLLPLAAFIYTGATVHSAIRHWGGSGGQWKGRSYDFGKISQ